MIFLVMIKHNSAKEGCLPQIEDCESSSETMKALLYFLYHDKVEKKRINSDLLKAANKYLVEALVDICSQYLMANLNLENALEVMIVAYHANQNALLDAAFKFACASKGKLVNTKAWQEMLKKYPDLIGKAFSQSMLQMQ